jgi:hypothetical protein
VNDMIPPEISRLLDIIDGAIAQYVKQEAPDEFVNTISWIMSYEVATDDTTMTFTGIVGSDNLSRTLGIGLLHAGLQHLSDFPPRIGN